MNVRKLLKFRNGMLDPKSQVEKDAIRMGKAEAEDEAAAKANA